MRNKAPGLGSIFFLMGAAAALAACTMGEPRRRPQPSATVTGAAGTGAVVTGAAGTGEPSPTPGIDTPTPGFDTGVAGAGAAGSSSCVGNGGPGMPIPNFRGMGIPPQLPTTVGHATTPVPAISGGTLLALADGNTAVASDPERDRLYIVDLANRVLRTQVALQAGDEPGRAVQDAAGRVHVALRRGGAVVTVDPTTGAIGGRRAVCAAPRGIAYQAAGDLLHVACGGGELVSLPAAGGAATRTVTLERDLRDVVVGADGKLMVSTFRRAEVLVVGADGILAPTRLRPSSGVKAPFLTPMPQPFSPSVAWRMVPAGGSSNNGSVVMLHQTGVDGPIDTGAGAYAGGKGCGSIVESAVTVVSPDGTATQPAGMQFVSLAVDLALSADGQQVALAVAGNAYTSGMPTVVSVPLTTVTGAPNPCVGVPDASFANGVSLPKASGQVVAVAFAKGNLLLAQTREPATLWLGDTGMSISLATDTRDDTGHLLFHVNAGGNLACASCHPEGGDDGRVWNFSCQGKRRTQSIRGGISGTAPFHWDGAETDFSHLMNDVFVGRMAGPQLSTEQMTSLQSWIDTIPALPVTKGLDAAAVSRGQAVFTDAKVACATCHAGTLMTNNTTVDVGTGLPLQVPSLRGVSWRAPFMHDGCAATLGDRFGTCGGGDKHGATSQLTKAQVGDLLTYLQSL
jgi:hypothetical protein